MDEIELCKLTKRDLFRLIQNVPFFRDILSKDPTQLKFILDYSKLIVIPPGDIVIRRGDFGFWIYFVLKGLLLVSPEYANEKSKNIVGHIAPGEMFGEMAIVRGAERNATVMADDNCKKIILLGTDFSPFGEVKDFSFISVSTKLIFYEKVIGILLKRIESFIIDFPDHPLVEKFGNYPSFSGKRGSIDELLYIHDKAIDYGCIPIVWKTLCQFKPIKSNVLPSAIE